MSAGPKDAWPRPATSPPPKASGQSGQADPATDSAAMRSARVCCDCLPGSGRGPVTAWWPLWPAPSAGHHRAGRHLGQKTHTAPSSENRSRLAGTQEIGAPGGIRTPDQWLRKPLLYPAELRARFGHFPARGKQGLRPAWEGDCSGKQAPVRILPAGSTQQAQTGLPPPRRRCEMVCGTSRQWPLRYCAGDRPEHVAALTSGHSSTAPAAYIACLQAARTRSGQAGRRARPGAALLPFAACPMNVMPSHRRPRRRGSRCTGN